MIRRPGRSTSALLQKVSSQLKGERVVQVSEEDDLNAYISSLTKRTTTKKSVEIDEDSEISISNEDYQYGGAPVTTSKYLKKKVNVQDSLDSVESLDPKDSVPQRFVKKTALHHESNFDDMSGPADRPATSRGPSKRSPRGSNFYKTARPAQRQSAALNKAQALANKISQRPAHTPSKHSNVFTLETDSEDSFHGPTVSSYKQTRRSPSPMRSASDSSMSLGKDGGKFVRKKAEPPAPPEFLTVKKTDSGENKSPATNEQKRPSTAVPGVKGRRNLVGNVMLSSEEESLAEFIEGLSGSDMSQRASSPTKPRSAVLPVHRSPSPDSKPPLRQTSPYSRPAHRPSSSPKPSVFRRTSSPPSQSRHLTESMESLPSQTPADSVSYEEDEEGDFKVNVVMDLDALGPVMSLDLEEDIPALKEKKNRLSSPVSSPFYKSPNTDVSGSKSKEKKSSIYSTKKLKKKDKSKGENEFFTSFGLHSVDELLGHESKDSSKEISVISDISEILTEKPSNIFQSKRRVNDSITEGYSEMESKAAEEPVSYSEAFESISEKIGEVSNAEDSLSEVKTQYSGEESIKDETYTEDFISQSENATQSDTDSYSSRSGYHSDSYTISSASIVSRRSPPDHGKKSVEVQTGDQPGLTYQWNTHHSGMAFMGPSFGMNFTDPTPIATHSVSPEALQALSSYSPAMLALHDMLKQQLELTQAFIQAQQYLYNSYTGSIEAEHKYTTLEDTKQYIRKHRKPKLSFKEALKLVDKEMT